MSETTIRTGKVDLEKLLKRTKHHPKGRVQIDEQTGEVKSPKNPIVEMVSTNKVEDGKVIVIEVPRYAGNVTGEGSIWRAAMCKNEMQVGGKKLIASCPEEMYHKLTELYEERVALGRGKDDFRPELSDAEMASYLAWKKKNVKETKPQD
jgi:hypothetical protein